jgi:predicted XRE-type DNA-binding protein
MKIKTTKSSGNVFADLGLPGADEHLVKAEIVLGIARRIKTRKLTQSQVAKLIGLLNPTYPSFCAVSSRGIHSNACLDFYGSWATMSKSGSLPPRNKKKVILIWK